MKNEKSQSEIIAELHRKLQQARRKNRNLKHRMNLVKERQKSGPVSIETATKVKEREGNSHDPSEHVAHQLTRAILVKAQNDIEGLLKKIA